MPDRNTLEVGDLRARAEMIDELLDQFIGREDVAAIQRGAHEALHDLSGRRLRIGPLELLPDQPNHYVHGC